MESEEVLKVQMLGGFTMTYCGKQLQLGKNQTTKVMQLLQLLLNAGPQGISRLGLMERLFDGDMEGDRANNLRVNIFHLRKMLQKTELPKEMYIRTENGRYYFDSSFPVEVDARRFEEHIRQAEQQKGEARLELLKKACYDYTGTFLPALTVEAWVVVEAVHLQNLYFSALEEVCGQMKERGEYTELLELASRAASLYPFDEWQTWQMECLMNLGRPMEAIALYEKTTELYYNELNMPPSERMLEYFRRMSSQVRLNTADFNRIQETLREDGGEKGAYFCSYPSFVDTYRMMVRLMERSGQSVYLLLCTLYDERQGKGIQQRKELSQKLSSSIKEALRRGDVYTCYNLSQYLVILTGIRKEECSIATNRIDACFRKKEGSRRVHISYRMASIIQMTDTESGVF